jgi:hypothetical protein
MGTGVEHRLPVSLNRSQDGAPPERGEQGSKLYVGRTLWGGAIGSSPGPKGLEVAGSTPAPTTQSADHRPSALPVWARPWRGSCLSACARFEPLRLPVASRQRLMPQSAWNASGPGRWWFAGSTTGALPGRVRAAARRDRVSAAWALRATCKARSISDSALLRKNCRHDVTLTLRVLGLYALSGVHLSLSRSTPSGSRSRPRSSRMSRNPAFGHAAGLL